MPATDPLHFLTNLEYNVFQALAEIDFSFIFLNNLDEYYAHC